MTDLLIPSDAAVDDVDAADRRTFRAATLDDAVAAARSELGPEVELIEAHRVRRGGLGGFFATDLGVEIVAERRRASAPLPQVTQPPLMIDDAPGASTPAPTAASAAPATDDGVATALDRLIEQAGAADLTQLQTTDPVASAAADLAVSSAPPDVESAAPLGIDTPAISPSILDEARAFDSVHDHAPVSEPATFDTSTAEVAAAPTRLDEPRTEEHPFEEHLKAALAALSDGSDEAAVEAVESPIPLAAEAALDDAADWQSMPSDPVVQELPVRVPGSTPPIEDASIPTFEPVASQPVEAIPWWRRTRTETPPPPPAPSAPIEASVVDISDTTRATETVDPASDDQPTALGMALERVRAGDPGSMASLHEAALVATDQLVEGVMSIWERSDHMIGRVSVSVTTTDGTTVCVASELSGDTRG